VAYLGTLGVPADRLEAIGVGTLPPRQKDWVLISVIR
jgi:hypothetical protein